MAATTRVRNIAKSLLGGGCKTEYIGLRGADVGRTPEKRSRGFSQGIRFSYPSGIGVRPQNWCLRRLDDYLGKWLSVLKLIVRKITRRIDIAIIYSRHYKTVIFWTRILHIFNIPVVLELCEWPLAIAETKGAGFKEATAFCHQAVLAVDAVLPISSYIEQEVAKIASKANKEMPSLRIPILIDTESTNEPIQVLEVQQYYLLYMGSLNYMDIARLIVDISAELKMRGQNISVKFTGGGFEEAFNELKAYAKDKGVLNRLDFTGFVSEQKLQELMDGAFGLLAPLPDNLQNRARFPTKLGYYLASGRPVFTTAVPSVCEYLADNKNAFIANTCNASSICDKIEQCYKIPDLGLRIGRKGKELALSQFYFMNACSKLVDFLMQIKNG